MVLGGRSPPSLNGLRRPAGLRQQVRAFLGEAAFILVVEGVLGERRVGVGRFGAGVLGRAGVIAEVGFRLPLGASPVGAFSQVARRLLRDQGSSLRTFLERCRRTSRSD
jgi:hypothetical protein